MVIFSMSLYIVSCLKKALKSINNLKSYLLGNMIIGRQRRLYSSIIADLLSQLSENV